MRGRCAGPVVLSVSLAAACGGADLHAELGELGYQELRPPTTLVPPGTIIVIRRREPIEVAVICTQQEVVKGGAVIKSPTKSVAFARKARASFNVGADYLRAFGIDAQGSHVKGTSMTLSRAEVWEIPDTALAASIPGIGADCKRAIDVRLAHYRTVGLVKSVLKADVVYTVEFDDSVNAAAKAVLLTDLALKLGGSVASTSSSQIKGDDLFWGILTDTDFFPSGGGGRPTLEAGPPVLTPGGPPIVRVGAKGDDRVDDR